MAKKASASSRPLRIVGKRRLPHTVTEAGDDLDGLSDLQISEWLATGGRIEAEPEEDSAAARAAEAIEMLYPSSFSTFTLLRDAIPDYVRERLFGGHKLLLIAHLPSKHWIEPSRLALSVAIESLAADAGVEVDASVSTRGIGRRFGGREVFSVPDIVAALNRTHVVVPVLRGEKIGSTVPALGDLELDLGPTSDTLLAAVRRRFAETALGIEADRIADGEPAVTTAIAGLQFYSYESSDGLEGVVHPQPGDRLSLVRQPENPHDANAVQVWWRNEHMIGHLPREIAADLAPAMDAGEGLRAYIWNDGNGHAWSVQAVLVGAAVQRVIDADAAWEAARWMPPVDVDGEALF